MGRLTEAELDRPLTLRDKLPGYVFHLPIMHMTESEFEKIKKGVHAIGPRDDQGNNIYPYAFHSGGSGGGLGVWLYCQHLYSRPGDAFEGGTDHNKHFLIHVNGKYIASVED